MDLEEFVGFGSYDGEMIAQEMLAWEEGGGV